MFHRAVKLDPEKNSRACARCQRRRARAGDWDDRGGHLRRWGEGIRNNKGMDSKSPFLGPRGSVRGHVQIFVLRVLGLKYLRIDGGLPAKDRQTKNKKKEGSPLATDTEPLHHNK